jgi:hypothetical protein
VPGSCRFPLIVLQQTNPVVPCNALFRFPACPSIRQWELELTKSDPFLRQMLLYEGVEAYNKEGPKFMQRLIAKQKLRTN